MTVRRPTQPLPVLLLLGGLAAGLWAAGVVVDPLTFSVLDMLPAALVGVEYGPRPGALAGGGAYLAVMAVAHDAALRQTPAEEATILVACLLVGALAGHSAQNLRTAAHRQRQLTDALGDMISVHRPDGRYVYASSAAATLMGYAPGDLIGTSAYEHLHPQDVGLTRRSHQLTLEGQAAQTAVHRVRRADGRFVWFETVSRAVPQEGLGVEIVCSSRDVTGRETDRLVEEENLSQLRDQVQHVLDEEGIDPALQPIVELASGAVVGYEALARFPSIPSRPPDVWFAHAVEVGLGVELEALAFVRALLMMAELPEEAFISLNVSPRLLASSQLHEALDDVTLDRLVLELTEHTAIEDYAGLRAAIEPLRAQGARLAVDDAGAGFASLRHILDMRPDIIKLDLSLTRYIQTDPARRALAKGILEFARSLDAVVVAEGIEEQAQVEVLQDLGIELGQGYLLGAPGPLPAAVA
jgi:PAS domain S-box-containing protein